ncbi:serine/threonine protein kinase [Cystobacter fuscus]|uniref:serine/threonine-protein kinase n=1 Tax=Cystobacter fuscus TaxID=43 RepID=UPI002B2D8326|nr:serine/threonine protein kinase [Cystobacter fuscus]
MADSRNCETCGGTVPVDTDICPRDGTVLLDFSTAPRLADPGSTRETSPGKNVHVMEDVSAQDTLVGLKVGEYELGQRIGVGGMGLVYDGIQPLIGKRVAVKVLRPELAAAEEQVARLLAEARAVNAIRHRGIVDIFGFGQVPDGRQYIIMEYLEGVALDAHLAERGRIPVPEVLDILDEVLSALGAAHGAGVVHRDLKPSNVFLVKQPDGSRYVKLLDFGLAKMGLPAGRTAQTRTDMVVGTPEYMAPEQARGQPVGPMTDLYALGVVAFEMITGRLPFTGTSPVDLLMKHVDARPPKPSEFLPGLPPALDAFILQMLTKDPEARPGSAELLRRQLQRLRDSLQAPVEVPAPPPAPSAPVRQSKPTVVESQLPALPEPPPLDAQEPLPTLEPLKTTPSVELPRTGGHSRRWLLPLGLGALGLGIVGGAVLVLRERPSPPAPPVAVVAPPRAEPKPPPPVANPVPPAPAAAADPGPSAVAQAPTPAGEAATPVPAVAHADDAQGSTQKGRAVAAAAQAPTQFMLNGRIRKLNNEIEARLATGQKLSPATRPTLEKIRKKVDGAVSAEERRQVATELDGWERLFLPRR